MTHRPLLVAALAMLPMVSCFDRAVRLSFTNAPHARVVKVEDSNHFIQFDQPSFLVAEVDALLRMPQ